ncbi:hypothetical protein [Arthrobacter sp. Leaf234]|nr:hypothetical protein [Arthrobacter sp. Leaf234]
MSRADRIQEGAAVRKECLSQVKNLLAGLNALGEHGPFGQRTPKQLPLTSSCMLVACR